MGAPMVGLQGANDVRPGGIGGQPRNPVAGNAAQAAQAQASTYRPEFGRAMTDAEYQAATQARTQQQAQGAQGAVQGGGPGSAYSVDPSGGVQYSVTAPPNLGIEKERLGLQSEFAGRERAQEAQFAEQAAQGQRSSQQALAALQNQAEMDFLNRRAQLGEQSFTSRLGAIQGSGVGAAPPREQQADIGFNEEGARAAAFARAKEQAGMSANAAIQSLRGLFEQQGTTGSTMEAARMGEALGGARADVGDFTQQQLMADLARAAQISDQRYSGGITQRGQDIAAKNALMALINSAGVVY